MRTPFRVLHHCVSSLQPPRRAGSSLLVLRQTPRTGAHRLWGWEGALLRSGTPTIPPGAGSPAGLAGSLRGRATGQPGHRPGPEGPPSRLPAFDASAPARRPRWAPWAARGGALPHGGRGAGDGRRWSVIKIKTKLTREKKKKKKKKAEGRGGCGAAREGTPRRWRGGAQRRVEAGPAAGAAPGGRGTAEPAAVAAAPGGGRSLHLPRRSAAPPPALPSPAARLPLPRRAALPAPPRHGAGASGGARCCSSCFCRRHHRHHRRHRGSPPAAERERAAALLRALLAVLPAPRGGRRGQQRGRAVPGLPAAPGHAAPGGSRGGGGGLGGRRPARPEVAGCGEGGSRGAEPAPSALREGRWRCLRRKVRGCAAGRCPGAPALPWPGLARPGVGGSGTSGGSVGGGTAARLSPQRGGRRCRGAAVVSPFLLTSPAATSTGSVESPCRLCLPGCRRCVGDRRCPPPGGSGCRGGAAGAGRPAARRPLAPVRRRIGNATTFLKKEPPECHSDRGAVRAVRDMRCVLIPGLTLGYFLSKCCFSEKKYL